MDIHKIIIGIIQTVAEKAMALFGHHSWVVDVAHIIFLVVGCKIRMARSAS
jgi:hypothetical protein